MRKYLIGIAGLMLLWFASCDKSDEGRSIRISNDSNTLSERVTTHNEGIAINPVGNYSASDFGLSVTYVAEITAPEREGSQFRATSVSSNLRNGLTVIGYETLGDENYGAIDVVTDQAGEGSKTAIYSHADISNTGIKDIHFISDHVYLAVSSDDPSISTGKKRALVEYLNVANGQLSTDRTNRKAITGIEALSVTADTQRVYATTGPVGGMAVFNSTLNAIAMSSYIKDARSIDFSDEYVVVQAADTDGDNFGSLEVFDRQNYSYLRTIEYEGRLPGTEKASVQIIGTNVVVAAGTGGVQFYSVVTGERLAKIARPNPVALGLADDQVITNDVIVDGDLIYISNKKAGIYVARAAMSLRRYPEGQPIEITSLGIIDMEWSYGISEIALSNGKLWVADGLAGVKLFSLHN